MTHVPASLVVSGPAEPETLCVFRAVASSVASRADMTLESIDELKIVVDEAATMLLRAGAPQRLDLILEPNGGTIRTTLTSDGAVRDWPGDRTTGWSWRVIRQLAREAACRAGERGPEVTFVMSTDAR
jgi:serine/threonine-protein kinase RsbW